MSDLFYRNRRLLVLTIALIIVAGVSAYQSLPRLEDPELIAESELAGLPLLPSDGETEQAKIGQITAASQRLVPILEAALESIR